MTVTTTTALGRPTSALGRSVNALGRAGTWWIVVALVVIGLVGVSQFGSATNLQNLLRQGSALGIVAIGQTLVILTGGMDLSVGALMGLVAVLANGTMAGRPENIPAAVAIAIVAGLAVGLFNGTMIVKTRINPIILTFGMLSVLQGLIFVYTDKTVGSSPPEFQALAYGSIAGIPTPALLCAVILVGAWALLRYTGFGRYLYAVGGNADHARRAGIPTGRVLLATYVLSSLLAAIAGLVLAARLGTGYTLAGLGFEIDAVVVVVLGGTALTGGRGGVIGTLAGLLVLSMVNNLLNLLAVSAYVQQVIKGVIVVAAVAVSGIAEHNRRNQR